MNNDQPNIEFKVLNYFVYPTYPEKRSFKRGEDIALACVEMVQNKKLSDIIN
jgi:hypothetical protein